VPLADEAVSVRRGGNPAFVCGKGFAPGPVTAGIPPGKIAFEASYTENVPVLPGYLYPWTFKAHVEVWARAY